MGNLRKDSKGFSHRDLGSTKVTEEVPALLFTVCVCQRYNPNPNNILCCCPLPMTDPSSLHARMDIIL